MDVKTEDLWLMQGDCLERMKEIPDSTVDAVICDPPYGTTSCKWDSIIPLEPMWEQLKRVIKPNGAIVMTACQPFTSILVCSNLKMFKYDWVWRKPKGTGHLNAKRMPMRDKEDIVVFYAKQPTYNPQWGVGTPYSKFRSGKSGKPAKPAKPIESSIYGRYMKGPEYRYGSDGRRYPKTVLEFGVVRDTVHPTQKPVALMEYLIKTYTNEGETVLDFTAGSGTTGVACKSLNRKFIGIELDKGYFEIAKNRIEGA